MNPIDYYNDPGLQTAQQASTQAGQAYQTAVKNAGTLPDMLYDTLNKKFTENNPLYAQRETALKNYMTVGETAPLDVLPENNQGMVFSPIEQAGMIAGKRADALAPITSLNELIGYQFGGIENIVDRTARMYDALAKAAQVEYENKRNSYRDLLELVGAKASQATTDRDFEENVRQFGLEYALNQQKTGESSNNSALEEMLTQLILGAGEENTTTPTEAKPTKVPAFGNPNPKTLYSSTKGEWVWDNQSYDWVPVID